ncbi:MAG: hypothetical protein IJO56_09925 [Oscillospiraceae bacterium]|nr:hypothetical protein [Oscillospiraceae bacterium]
MFNKLIDNIASQGVLVVIFWIPYTQIKYIFLYISGVQGAAVSMFALLAGVCRGRRVFHQELSITPLWGVGKPVVNPAGWFRFPAAAAPPPQRLFFLVLFLLEVTICLHESRQINSYIK